MCARVCVLEASPTGCVITEVQYTLLNQRVWGKGSGAVLCSLKASLKIRYSEFFLYITETETHLIGKCKTQIKSFAKS